MASFTDMRGKEWVLFLDAFGLEDVRKECGVDLVSLDGKGCDAMVGDQVLLVRVLWILFKEEASRRNIGPREFAQSLVGEAIGRATEAMLDAIVDFSHGKQKEALTLLRSHKRAVREAALDTALTHLKNEPLKEQDIAAVKASVDQLVRKSIQSTNATPAPATAESVPAV